MKVSHVKLSQTSGSLFENSGVVGWWVAETEGDWSVWYGHTSWHLPWGRKNCLKSVTGMFCSTSLRDHLLHFSFFFLPILELLISQENSQVQAAFCELLVGCQRHPPLSPFFYWGAWMDWSTGLPLSLPPSCSAESRVRYFTGSWNELCCVATRSVLWCHTHLIDLCMFWKNLCHRTMICLTYQICVRIKQWYLYCMYACMHVLTFISCQTTSCLD